MIYRENPDIAKKYKSKRWQKLRKQKLLETNGLCERCFKNGIFKSAYIVHHKEYITEKNFDNDNVFFNIDNLESLCITCHNKEHFEEQDSCIFDENGDLVSND